MPETLTATRRTLEDGSQTASALAEKMLSAINAPSGEGRRIYIRVNEQLREQASLSDLRRARGQPRGILEGVALSLKDNFDQANQVTTAGSAALSQPTPAQQDAVVVRRLESAGALFTGRTNMTEFAFSALGLNPRFGTPLCPYERSTRRIPGGSSAGAAVSVTDGMAVAAIGTDTGGSIRIPAAFCGLVGFKPTARRVPLAGVFPLAPSLDSVGSIGRSVDCCMSLDRVMTADGRPFSPPADLRGLRLLQPSNFVLDNLEPAVANSFERALHSLSQGGAVIVRRKVPALEQSLDFGGIYARESWLYHHHVAVHAAASDPRVRLRIEAGRTISGLEYAELLSVRKKWATGIAHAISDCAALIMPTVSMIAPALEPLELSDDLYYKTNLQVMRNARIFNILDGCAMSLPCHAAGSAPVGLTIGAAAMSDERVLSVGLAVEAQLARHTATNRS